MIARTVTDEILEALRGHGVQIFDAEMVDDQGLPAKLAADPNTGRVKAYAIVTGPAGELATERLSGQAAEWAGEVSVQVAAGWRRDCQWAIDRLLPILGNVKLANGMSLRQQGSTGLLPDDTVTPIRWYAPLFFRIAV